jgi:hypothetical protein
MHIYKKNCYYGSKNQTHMKSTLQKIERDNLFLLYVRAKSRKVMSAKKELAHYSLVRRMKCHLDLSPIGGNRDYS